MSGFFGLDGPFYKWGTEVADVMILSVLWLICSIPIFTIGASTTALFYVYGKKVRGEDPYIIKGFFKSFKNNFKQATILTFIIAILGFSSYLYFKILTGGEAQLWIKIVGLFFMMQVTIIVLYAFPVLSRFHMPIKNIIISSFMFGNKHIISTIACAVLLTVSIFFILTPTPITIVSFGIYGLLSSFIFQRIFTKHIELMEENKKANQENTQDDEDGNLIEHVEEMANEE